MLFDHLRHYSIHVSLLLVKISHIESSYFTVYTQSCKSQEHIKDFNFLNPERMRDQVLVQKYKKIFPYAQTSLSGCYHHDMFTKDATWVLRGFNHNETVVCPSTISTSLNLSSP